MTMRAAVLLACTVLGGCAGVSTLPVYQSRSGAWTSPEGGNPFVLHGERGTVQFSVLGLWPHWWWVGPMPLPLIPSPYPGRELTVVLTAQPPARIDGEAGVRLLADGAELALLDRRAQGDEAVYRFGLPAAHPQSVTVAIDGLPPAMLAVGRERCYWVGDSHPSYRDCSAAAQSADPPR